MILHLNDVHKSYSKKRALNGVSFAMDKGEVVGLLGPNGSGKTTLMKILNTLIMEYSGEVLICGSKPGVETKAVTSYMPDKDYLREGMKIRAICDMHADFFADFDKAKAVELLKLTKLEENSKVSALSKGMRERLMLVLTMARKASLYVLDEPFAAVDPAARELILATILKNYHEDGAVLISTHLIADVEPILTRALFMKDGAIYIDANADDLREERGMSLDKIFREEYRYDV